MEIVYLCHSEGEEGGRVGVEFGWRGEGAGRDKGEGRTINGNQQEAH